MGRLEGKVVVVTGGARGIGRGCAEMLIREGARVVVGDVLDEEGEATVRVLGGAEGRALYRHADVLAEEQCQALMADAVAAYGRLDGLVNNAGWYPRATLEETTGELWDRVLALNLRSAFYCCKHAVGPLRAAGGGSIVNIGSFNGLQGLTTLVAYSAAKGGLLALTRTLAGALAADRIRVNYVIPGWVLTEGEVGLQTSRGISEEVLRQAGERLTLGRHQTPQDAAYAVVYLLSDEAVQVTGTVLNVDAGASSLPRHGGGQGIG